MRSKVQKNPRLKELYRLEKQISQEMLGKTRLEYRKLARLRGKVREEIRNTDEWGHIRNSEAYKKWLETKNAEQNQ